MKYRESTFLVFISITCSTFFTDFLIDGLEQHTVASLKLKIMWFPNRVQADRFNRKIRSTEKNNQFSMYKIGGERTEPKSVIP